MDERSFGYARAKDGTFADLVAGSGIALDDAGEHELNHVAERWRLYRIRTGG